MRRVWRVSEFHKRLTSTHNPITKPPIPVQFTRHHADQTPRTDTESFSDIVTLFTEKLSCNSSSETVAKRVLVERVRKLKEELLSRKEDAEGVEKVLEENGVGVFRRYDDGSAVVELLTQLKGSPDLAMEVFNWRRRQLDCAAPMTSEEYVKGIVMAGRSKNVDLAVELFKEASNKQLKCTSVYNALMSVYMYSGLGMRCQLLFRDMKMEPTCTPSIITYNILISAFGRLMLVDHMEATLKEIKDLNLPFTVSTYNALIGGYITAWKWEEMENTYQLMKAASVGPDLGTLLLMLRGYAIAGKLEKMEEIYERVKDHVNHKEIPLIRIMISAYCKSSDVARVEKVEEMLRLIPENEYRSWLNVMLICLYAKEDLLEQMEKSIQEAFEHKTNVTTSGVMKCIISNYFRHDAVDKLADFIRNAEHAGWKTCRPLYHCKMVMYSSQMRLSEMEGVLDEMARLNIHLSKKTFWILHKAYQKWGQRDRLEQLVVMMCKCGYGIPLDPCDTVTH